MKGIKYTAKEKENALKKWIVDGEDVFKVAKKTNARYKVFIGGGEPTTAQRTV